MEKKIEKKPQNLKKKKRRITYLLSFKAQNLNTSSFSCSPAVSRCYEQLRLLFLLTGPSVLEASLER